MLTPLQDSSLSTPVLAWVPGPMELVLILAVFLLLFGARKLPELAKSMGSSITQFKKGLKESNDTDAPGPGADSGRDKNEGQG